MGKGFNYRRNRRIRNKELRRLERGREERYEAMWNDEKRTG